jgi:hypothetical protein
MNVFETPQCTLFIRKLDSRYLYTIAILLSAPFNIVAVIQHPKAGSNRHTFNRASKKTHLTVKRYTNNGLGYT